jgi:hypothetical protein
MSQRIHLNPNAPRAPMMGQGYQPTPATSTPSYRPNSNTARGAGGQNEVLGQVQAWSSKAEDLIEAYTQVRPSAGGFGRMIETEAGLS